MRRLSTGEEESVVGRNEASNAYKNNNNEVEFRSDVAPGAVGAVMALVRQLPHTTDICGLCRCHGGLPGRPRKEALWGDWSRGGFVQGEI